MLRTLAPPFTQSVEQAERIIGVGRGTAHYWSRNEKVGKAIIRARLAVSMSAAPEILGRVEHMAKAGDKFSIRMWFEHVAELARDPVVMGTDLGRALANVDDGQMASLTVIADKRRGNGHHKPS